jgi:conjugal transfer pilus assembly protein TraV
MRKGVLASMMVLSLSGCFLNPYESDFTCPHVEGGKCVSVQSAYDESVEVSRKKKSEMSLQDELDDQSKHQKGRTGAISAGTRGGYQEALYTKLAGLLNEPATPLVAPPTVMRVLMLPYKGDGNRLFMPRYVFMFIDDPHWILDERSATEGVK